MNIQYTLLGIVVAIFLVASSFGAPTDGGQSTVTVNSNSTNPLTTLFTSITISTAAPITTARATSDPPVTSAAPTTTSNTTNPTSDTPVTTPASSTTSTNTAVPTTKAPRGRKFDGLSFIGGMILAGGLGGILFLVVSYLRRNHRLPYSTMR